MDIDTKTGIADGLSYRRLAIASGGTGGHFYPGLSVARLFRKEVDGEVLMLLSGKHTEAQSRAAESHGIATVVVDSAPRPTSLIQCFTFVFKVLSGIMSARRELKNFAPDAVLGMGSFASFTASVAAWTLGIPIFLHEGNARIGKTNRFLSRWARYLAISFPPVNSSECKCPISCTGMPVRPELLGEHLSRERALELINSRHNTSFDPSKPLLLIFGGSQGAQAFNRTLPAALMSLGERAPQVIHLSGKGKLEEVKAAYDGAAFANLALEEVEYIGALYSACDAIFCRAGASSIAEISLFNRYSFLVPYPFAAEQHQDDNANVLHATGAATVIRQQDFDCDHARVMLEHWLEHRGEYAANAENCHYIARPEASGDLLRLIDECLLYGNRKCLAAQS